MPQALPILAAVAQAAEAYAVSVALTAAYIGISAYQQRKEADAAQQAHNNSLQGRTTTFRNSAAARRIIYGRQRVGGDTIIYQTRVGASTPTTVSVVAIAAAGAA